VNQVPDLQEYLGNDYKVYVDVNADHISDGTILPRHFFWEDGRRYDIDKILDIRPAASLKAGGLGLRYTVRVMNKKIFLFLEEDHGACRWFLERK
jgi:hypothetical protein